MPTFLPSRFLTVYLFTFLFFKILVFIRVRLWFPLSSFLFSLSYLWIKCFGFRCLKFAFLNITPLFIGILNRPGLTNHHDFDLTWKG